LNGNRSSSSYLLFTILILFCLFNLLAFLWVLSVSFKGMSEFLASSPWVLPKQLAWSNYVNAWKIGHIKEYLFNSVYVTSVSTVGCLIFSSMAAYILARIKFRFSGLIQVFFLLGMMLPPFMIVIPLFDILMKLSLLNNLNGLILVYITMQLPFNVFVLMSFYKNLPMDLEEAASIDGASPLAVFGRIMLPLTIPPLVACGIINILHIWNEFLFALVFLNDKKVFTLPIGIFNLNQAADYSSNWGVLFAGIVISSIPVLVLFALFQNQFTKGITQGAIKM
jgi:ABC-type glycerol-3-phosphate transport system permease component